MNVRKESSLKREGGFDRIETVAEMHEETLRHLHAGFNPESFNTGLYNTRRPPTLEEFNLDLKVEVESLRTELLLSQPLPLSQLDLPPRRRRSPVRPPPEIPPCSSQTDQGGTFPFQADTKGFLHANCTRILKQRGGFSRQADVGMDPEVQVTARQEFARLPMNRQQRGVIASSKESNLTRPGDGEIITFSSGICPFPTYCAFCFMFAIFPCLSCQVREARRMYRRGWKRLEYMSQMDKEQLFETSWSWIILVLTSVKGTVV